MLHKKANLKSKFSLQRCIIVFHCWKTAASNKLLYSPYHAILYSPYITSNYSNKLLKPVISNLEHMMSQFADYCRNIMRFVHLAVTQNLQW